jgi:hypothetical protein
MFSELRRLRFSGCCPVVVKVAPLSVSCRVQFSVVSFSFLFKYPNFKSPENIWKIKTGRNPVLWILIGWNADPDFVYGSGSRVLMPKNCKNFTAESKSNFFDQNLLFCSSLGPHKGRSSYRRSLHPSKENIQHFKAWNLFTLFYFLWDIFALLNPDPAGRSQGGSGSTTLEKLGETRSASVLTRLQSGKHNLFKDTVVRYRTLEKGGAQHLRYRYRI